MGGGILARAVCVVPRTKSHEAITIIKGRINKVICFIIKLLVRQWRAVGCARPARARLHIFPPMGAGAVN